MILVNSKYMFGKWGLVGVWLQGEKTLKYIFRLVHSHITSMARMSIN